MNDTTLLVENAARKVSRKWIRVLRALANRPTLNRFQAETDAEIRDHCLNSTIPEIERKGVRIDRRMVKLYGFGGAPVFCCEYSLDDEQRSKARMLLGA